jgi:asparagine N-glycosylation enzyme membrane subunit Stt3
VTSPLQRNASTNAFLQFDPWFNYRATQHLVKDGLYDFLNWFDGKLQGAVAQKRMSLLLTHFFFFFFFFFSKKNVHGILWVALLAALCILV